MLYKMSGDNQTHIRLSPSTIALARECPRCFWLQQREKIRRPSGPFPSLPGGMDGVIKKYFDIYRKKNELPPEIEGKVEGKLFPDIDLLNQWRNWRTGLRYTSEELNATLSGAIDDLLMDDDGYYMVLDYKTRGYPLKEDTVNYYQHQLDLYTFLLQSNNRETNGIAYLIYFHPEEFKEGGITKFAVTVKKEETSIKRAKEMFESAVRLVRGGLPKSHHSCAFCAWGSHLGTLD